MILPRVAWLAQDVMRLWCRPPYHLTAFSPPMPLSFNHFSSPCLQHFYKGRVKSGVQSEDRPPVQVRW